MESTVVHSQHIRRVVPARAREPVVAGGQATHGFNKIIWTDCLSTWKITGLYEAECRVVAVGSICVGGEQKTIGYDIRLLAGNGVLLEDGLIRGSSCIVS